MDYTDIYENIPSLQITEHDFGSKCVYVHFRKDTGEVFYVGSGTMRRSRNFTSRSFDWLKINEAAGGTNVGYLIRNVSKQKSLQIETEVIQYFSKMEEVKLVNKKDVAPKRNTTKRDTTQSKPYRPKLKFADLRKFILAKRSLLNRLTEIKRENYARTSCFKKAIKKQNGYIQRLATVIICILEQREMAIDNARKLKEVGILKRGQEFLHVISLVKLYCIMSGGSKIIRTRKGFTHIPLTSTHNEEVKMIVQLFFTCKFRGNETSGSSKWVVKEIPKFGHHIMSILNKIRETNKDVFDQIGSYLISKDTDTISLNFCPIHTVDPKDLNELLDHFRSSSVFNKKHDDFR